MKDLWKKENSNETVTPASVWMSLFGRGLPWPPSQCSSLITGNQLSHVVFSLVTVSLRVSDSFKKFAFSPKRIPAPWSSMHCGLLFHWLGFIGNKTRRRRRHMCALSVCVCVLPCGFMIYKELTHETTGSVKSTLCRLQAGRNWQRFWGRVLLFRGTQLHAFEFLFNWHIKMFSPFYRVPCDVLIYIP